MEECLTLSNALRSLLGSDELVARWWTSPNKAFNGKTPESVCKSEEGEKVVIHYVLQHLGY